jgi:hypothetical protein
MMLEMSPKRFFIQPIKNRFFLAFISIHLAFVFIFDKLFGKSFFLAPDEKGYLQVAKDIYGADYDYVQWGWPWRTPVWFLQILYSPFNLMNNLGVTDLIAFRINSLIYTSASLYLVLCVVNATSLIRQPKFSKNISVATFLIPTFFLWGSLGLRESFLFLAFSLLGSGLFLIELKKTRLGLLLMMLGCILLAYTKDYMFLIFLFSIALLSIIRIIQRRIYTISLVCYFIALLAPILITPTLAIALHDQVTQIVFGEEVPRANLSGNSTAGEVGAWSTERGLAETCQNNVAASKIIDFIRPSEKIVNDKSCANSGVSEPKKGQELLAGGESEPEKSQELLTGREAEWQFSRAARLSLEPAHVTDPKSIVIQLIKVSVLPAPFIDNGSSILNLVSWEFWIWILLILLPLCFISMDLLLKNRISDLRIWGSLMFLGVLFSCALTEINVGTMVRHRSLILIPCLFVVLTTDFSNYHFAQLRKSAIRFIKRGK